MTQNMEIRPAGSMGGPHGGASTASTLTDVEIIRQSLGGAK